MLFWDAIQECWRSLSGRERMRRVLRPRKRRPLWTVRLTCEQLEDRDVPSGGQWASTVLAYSSQYSSSSWSAAQALGQPNTNAYGDIVTAWAPLPENGTSEYLSLGYATPGPGRACSSGRPTATAS